MIDQLEYLAFEQKISELQKHGIEFAVEYVMDVLRRLNSMGIMPLSSAPGKITQTEYQDFLNKVSKFCFRNLVHEYKGPHFIEFDNDSDLLQRVIRQCYLVDCTWNFFVDLGMGANRKSSVKLWMSDPDALVRLKLIIDTI